jgi:hypothetical protein
VIPFLELAIKCGDKDTIRRVVTSYRDCGVPFVGMGGGSSLVSTYRLLAEGMSILGDYDSANALFAGALIASEGLKHRPEAACLSSILRDSPSSNRTTRAPALH